MYDTNIKREHQIPVSSGIPPLVIIASLFGLLIIFGMGALVIWTSGQGHVWPAESSMQIKL